MIRVDLTPLQPTFSVVEHTTHFSACQNPVILLSLGFWLDKVKNITYMLPNYWIIFIGSFVIIFENVFIIINQEKKLQK